MVFHLDNLSSAEKQYYLQHIVAPRPIAFASTMDKEGNVNLSPFSFFNLFSANPPIVIFSPSKRVRDNSHKHTLMNVLEVPEVAINIVTEDLVQQSSLASCDYPRGTDEFRKAGLTPEKSTLIRPPMVKESVARLECKVIEVKPLGDNGGAGQLVICEVLCVHIADELVDANKKIDQRKLRLVARLGGDWYCRVDESSLFTVPKPNTQLGIGFDSLPDGIRNSSVLTGNQLAQLANVHELPSLWPGFDDEHLKNIIQYYSLNPGDLEAETHRYASRLLSENKVNEAWQVLLRGE